MGLVNARAGNEDQRKEYRITELLELKRTLKAHSVQFPCNKQGHLQPDQVSQCPNQPINVPSVGVAFTTSLGNLFQCLTILIVKILFLISNLNLPSFSLKPFPLVLSQQNLLKILLSYSPLFRYRKTAIKSLQSHNYLNLSLQRKWFIPWIISVALL